MTQTEDMRIEIIERISKLPNLQKQINHMKLSNHFKDLGEALSPIFIATKIEKDWPISKQVESIAKEEHKQLKEKMRETGVEVLAFLGGNGNSGDPEPAPAKIIDPLACNNCGAPVETQTKTALPTWIKPHQAHALDFFAGIIVFVMWLAATAWMLSSFGVTYSSVIGLGVFWIIFIIVYRVVAGGILD